MSALILKIVAAVSMTADHAGKIFFPGAALFPAAGRLAFPIFAFLAARGFEKTASLPRYMARMLLCAAAAEPFFDLLWYGAPFSLAGQNVCFTLALGLCACALSRIKSPLRFFLPVLPLLAAHFAAVDYGAAGAALVLLFYLCRKSDILTALAELLFCALYSLKYPPELWGCFAAPLLVLYSGRPGPKNALSKYFFYAYYPAHMALIVLMRTFI